MKRCGRFLGYLLLTLAIFSPALAQQWYFYPYYGKNRVTYEDFQWKKYPTEHFNLYYYAENPQILKNLAELSESAYLKVSETLRHQLDAPVPLIFYTTYTDFEQSNLFQVGEGVLGVSEPILHRIGLNGDLSLDELSHVVEHELTHIFEFDILWGGQGVSLYALNIPALWLFEGLSEYTTRNWSTWSSMIVRDAVLNDRIPDITESGDLDVRFPMPRDPAYDFGHAIYDFIEERYGKNGIKELWQSMKNSPLVGRITPLKKAFNVKPFEFNHEFKKYLREKNRKFLLRENPEDYSIPLGPQFPRNPYYFTFSHAVSPSGDLVAGITYNVTDFEIDIVLISTRDGSIVKNLTKGFTTDYEYIRYDYDPSTGKSLAWSPDGDTIAFFGRDGRRYSLYLIDPVRGRTLKKIKVRYDQPSSPCFFPDGRAILFTAFNRGAHDIFKLNLATGEVENLTQDDYFEKAPAISPDGQSVAYTVRVDIYDKIFLSPLNDLGQKTQLTFGTGNTTCPSFSPDSQEIYFSGDVREAFNIYSVHLGSGEITRYSDVWTGNFFPSPDPVNPRRIIFSSFNKGAYQIFAAELAGAVEERVTFAALGRDRPASRFRPTLTMDIDQSKISDHRGIGNLYVSGRPPIDVTVSTDGSIYGGTAIGFGDLIGDHNFSLIIFQSRGFRSYFLSYLNQKKRLQFMPSVYEYTIFYYPPYAYYDPSLYYRLTYKDAAAYRKITSANVSVYYPFNRYYRLEGNFGFYRYEENFLDPYSLGMSGPGSYGYFWNGNTLNLSLSFVGETTFFNPYYGPRAGHTFRLAVSQALPVAHSFLRSTTVQADLRKYLYIGGETLLALRFEGWASRGRNPYVFYYGGNNQVRSSYYYNIISSEGWFANAEFRLPLINVASTLLGPIGPVRGALIFDLTRSKLNGYDAKFYVSADPFSAPLILEAMGSYGFGVELFFLGLPLHIEFIKMLGWEDFSRPLDFKSYGKFETKFWIGLDF
jgi:WD40 repeat protein